MDSRLTVQLETSSLRSRICSSNSVCQDGGERSTRYGNSNQGHHLGGSGEVVRAQRLTDTGALEGNQEHHLGVDHDFKFDKTLALYTLGPLDVRI